MHGRLDTIEVVEELRADIQVGLRAFEITIEELRVGYRRKDACVGLRMLILW